MGALFKPISGMPHIGFFGELGRRRSAMGGVWPMVVVVVPPGRQHGAGVRQ